jgi:hypothetical protein
VATAGLGALAVLTSLGVQDFTEEVKRRANVGAPPPSSLSQQQQHGDEDDATREEKKEEEEDSRRIPADNGSSGVDGAMGVEPETPGKTATAEATMSVEDARRLAALGLLYQWGGPASAVSGCVAIAVGAMRSHASSSSVQLAGSQALEGFAREKVFENFAQAQGVPRPGATGSSSQEGKGGPGLHPLEALRRTGAQGALVDAAKFHGHHDSTVRRIAQEAVDKSGVWA